MTPPVWMQNATYMVADLWCRVVFRTEFLYRRCGRCGETRYNHTHGRMRRCTGRPTVRLLRGRPLDAVEVDVDKLPRVKVKPVDWLAAKARPRLWRYEVDEVWGDAPVSVGTVLIDKWKSPAEWTVINLNTGKTVSSWHAKRLGEVTGDVAESVYKNWDLASTFKEQGGQI